MKLRDANAKEKKLFMEKYCRSETARSFILEDFQAVSIDSYEQLLPGQSIRSYCTGNRAIQGEFMIFRVVDKNGVVYHPVFSERVGRQLANKAGLKVPRKMSIFFSDHSGNGGSSGRNAGKTRKKDNTELLLLIQFTRSMMLLHVENPLPLYGPFKNYYDNLYEHPEYGVTTREISFVNEKIFEHITKQAKKPESEHFKSLQDYIAHIKRAYPNIRLKDTSFKALREKLLHKYPNKPLYF